MTQGHQRLIATLIPIINSLFLACRGALHISDLWIARGRYALLPLVLFSSSALANHSESDGCPDTHVSSGTDLSTELTVQATGQPVYDGMILPTSISLLMHMRGTAYGRCEVFSMLGGQCVQTATLERSAGPLRLYATIESASQNGDYYLGQILGKDPTTGQTAWYHELDSHDTTTSNGPLYPYVGSAGTYRVQNYRAMGGEFDNTI